MKLTTILDLLYSIVVLAALVALARLLTSCVATRSPDGTWSFGLDVPAAVEVIRPYTK